MLYNVWKNINKEKYNDMCAALSLPSTNTSSALNAVLSGITVQSDEYQAGVGFDWNHRPTVSVLRGRSTTVKYFFTKSEGNSGWFFTFSEGIGVQFPTFFPECTGCIIHFFNMWGWQSVWSQEIWVVILCHILCHLIWKL